MITGENSILFDDMNVGDLKLKLISRGHLDTIKNNTIVYNYQYTSLVITDDNVVNDVI